MSSDDASPARRLLVIGVGHRDRADDGIGPSVVDALSHRTDRVTTVVREGDLAVLPLLWEPDDDVVIVDASMAMSTSVGELHEIDPVGLVSTMAMSTHGIGVAEAIELATRLGMMPARLRVMSITARDFSCGPMSRELHARVDDLADQLLGALLVDDDEAASAQRPSDRRRDI